MGARNNHSWAMGIHYTVILMAAITISVVRNGLTLWARPCSLLSKFVSRLLLRPRAVMMIAGEAKTLSYVGPFLVGKRLLANV
jgi:hypothetical protein